MGYKDEEWPSISFPFQSPSGPVLMLSLRLSQKRKDCRIVCSMLDDASLTTYNRDQAFSSSWDTVDMFISSKTLSLLQQTWLGSRETRKRVKLLRALIGKSFVRDHICSIISATLVHENAIHGTTRKDRNLLENIKLFQLLFLAARFQRS